MIVADIERIKLRQYQEDAVVKIIDSLERGENPVCSLPTGSGKSVVIGELCRRLDGRILVVTHRQELLSQNESILLKLGDEDAGVYSAGLMRRECDSRIIFAGIQSIYRRMEELQMAGKFEYVVIDEAHLVAPPSDSNNVMYNTVLSACDRAQRIALTATAYRLNDGPIWGDTDAWFDTLAVHAGISELTDAGYLSPLVGVRTACDVDLSNVRKRGGDFVTSDLSQASSEESVVKLALDEVCYLAKDRKQWLLFGVDRSHARLIRDGLLERGVDTEIVLGDTPKEARSSILNLFKAGYLRALVNVGVLTTGFDAPGIDCVALLRASASKSLVVQMLGRGSRLSAETGKCDCLVLDLAGNLKRHVPLDGIPKVMRSPQLVEVEEQEEKDFKERERGRKARHGYNAELDIDPLTGKSAGNLTLRVNKMMYKLTPAKRYPGRQNLMVIYDCGIRQVRQWLCPEYPGFVSSIAANWFHRRGIESMPNRASECLKLAWKTPKPSEIVICKDGDWDRVMMEYFEE